MTSFQSFGLAEPIARALAEERYLTLTPIQAQTVPLALDGRVIIGIAQTGTGRTAAFALPISQLLSASKTAPEWMLNSSPAVPANSHQDAQRPRSHHKPRGERPEGARSRAAKHYELPPDAEPRDREPHGREPHGREPHGRERRGDKRYGVQCPVREHSPLRERYGHEDPCRAVPPHTMGAATNLVANGALAAPSILGVEDLSRVAFLHRAINKRHNPQTAPRH